LFHSSRLSLLVVSSSTSSSPPFQITLLGPAQARLPSFWANIVPPCHRHSPSQFASSVARYPTGSHYPHSAHPRLTPRFSISDPTSCILIHILRELRRATFTLRVLLTAQHGATATATPAAAAAATIPTASSSAAAPGWRRPWAYWA
jgi:hypothetical protein